MAESARRYNPDVDRRLKRNHYSSSSDWPVSKADLFRGVNIIPDNNAVRTASEQASEDSQQYRFGKVNCIRSQTQIQGDDTSMLEEDT